MAHHATPHELSTCFTNALDADGANPCGPATFAFRGQRANTAHTKGRLTPQLTDRTPTLKNQQDSTDEAERADEPPTFKAAKPPATKSAAAKA